ncbi:GNAT family N-acetyltransferase [Falsirhodobacter xinxiangensis]|uniref:GNAT family N-acetyltransferase n=1 Tax=Falsirhodobacter xinxiangensis TaxID=2530049 RepID=UPI001C70A7D0|nr:N-acetyltransferase [Rhodobacter xinxiangensis]
MGTETLIRDARSADHTAIAGLLRRAFDGDGEAALVTALRPAAIELVAERDGELLGHILLSALEAPFRALALAPVAVEPVWQGQGVGAALIRAAISRASGWDAIVVLGDPAYYTRFGFSVEAAAGFACVYAGPYLMLLPLGEVPATGRIVYPQAFSTL